MLADGVLQSLMAVGELRARLGCRFENEQRMRERVIADDVSCLRHRARNIGALLHVAADHEKRCSHIVLRQHVEQLQRVRIVRPVIVGQGDLLASADSSGKRPSDTTVLSAPWTGTPRLKRRQRRSVQSEREA